MDLFIAFAIIIILVIIFVITWNRISVRINDRTTYDDLQVKTFQISDLLINSPGSPSLWEKDITNLRVIGLASDDGVLSTKKIENFVNLSYNKTKELFNIEPYEFYFQIKDLNQNNLAKSGISPQENNDCNLTYSSVSLRRYVLWENERVIMQFILWDDPCVRYEGEGQSGGGELIIYVATPELAYEEDNDPTWTTEIQAIGGSFATAVDEGFMVPDHVHFDFPDLGILPGTQIINVSLTIIHREDLSGGTMPMDDRHMIRCWNGIWNDVETYTISPDPLTWVEYSNIDISSCISTVALANDIHIIMTYDPAFDAGATIDIDFVEIQVGGI